jgi:hypothetical protein
MRSASITLLACASLLLPGAAAPAGFWDTIAFRDDCDGAPGEPPDADAWIVNHPGSWWWVQGRTQFPDPLSTTGPFPHVEDGVCVIEHHHYNPWDLGDPKATFLGGEIRSILAFEPHRAYRFEARVRSNAYPNGLVSSFFLYGYDGANADEIDFEFLSNETNDDASHPGGDPVLTNPWNESVQQPLLVPVAGLDLSRWQTFRIYWYPGIHRIEWTWLDPLGGETLLRREDGVGFVPDQAMSLYFNFWAPDTSWPDAYHAGLQPANESGADQTYRYEIDYAEARVLSEDVPALSKTGVVAAALLIAGLLLRLPLPTRGGGWR